MQNICHKTSKVLGILKRWLSHDHREFGCHRFNIPNTCEIYSFHIPNAKTRRHKIVKQESNLLSKIANCVCLL